MDDSLHGEGTIDEVGRFVVDVLDVDDDSLVVGICWAFDGKLNIYLKVYLISYLHLSPAAKWEYPRARHNWDDKKNNMLVMVF